MTNGSNRRSEAQHIKNQLNAFDGSRVREQHIGGQTKENENIFMFTWMCNCARFLCVFNSLISLQCDMRQYIYERSYAMNTISSRLNFYEWKPIELCNRTHSAVAIAGWAFCPYNKIRIVRKQLVLARFRASVSFSTAKTTSPLEWPGYLYECARNAIYRNEKSFKCAEFRAPMIMNIFFSFSYRKSDSFPLRCVVAKHRTRRSGTTSFIFCYFEQKSRSVGIFLQKRILNALYFCRRSVSPMVTLISWLDSSIHINGEFLRSNWRQYKT